jgi:putative methyltransferase (TIGR04325 family)
MRVRRIVRSIVPVGLLDLYHRLRRRSDDEPPFIWEGVFERLADVPVRGGGYGSERWVMWVRGLTQKILDAHQRNGPMPRDIEATVTSEHRTFLAMAGVIAGMRGAVTVLDLGGALGSGYVYLIDSLPRERRVAYHVVELARLCEEGARLFAADPRITFHSTLPPVRDVDIVYVNGALQHFADYTGTIQTLAAYQAPVILYTDLPAGDIPTFATAQMNIDGSVGTWFFNLDEIVVLMTPFELRARARREDTAPLRPVESPRAISGDELPHVAVLPSELDRPARAMTALRSEELSDAGADPGHVVVGQPARRREP